MEQEQNELPMLDANSCLSCCGRAGGCGVRAMLRFPPRASGGPLQAEFRVRGPRTSARKSVWRGSWASRDLGLQEFLEAQMDLEAQMEAQIHF